jgi:16S rRNA (uracil1498-N3)-methyltransferase
MARYDFRSPRLFVAQPLVAGTMVPLDPGQRHYLAGVLRLARGDRVLAFNGTDGEWHCTFAPVGKKSALRVERQVRPQDPPGDLHYLFAPLKRARLDYMVQKAVEMGVSRLQPVMSRHTQAERINLERMQANAIEAAEQCGILSLPEIMPPLALERAIAALEPRRHLVFCDEEAPSGDPVAALVRDLAGEAGEPVALPRPLAVLIGPEGGFDDTERAFLLRRPHTSRIALGPRILRADTAAVAALAIVQAAGGDWRTEPASPKLPNSLAD